MSQSPLPELEGWQDIVDHAGMDNEPSRAQAIAQASYRQVLAIANLSKAIFNSQKHISQRLEVLNSEIGKATQSSEKLSTQTYVLTWVLAIATAIQAIAAVVLIFKAKG